MKKYIAPSIANKSLSLVDKENLLKELRAVPNDHPEIKKVKKQIEDLEKNLMEAKPLSHCKISKKKNCIQKKGAYNVLRKLPCFRIRPQITTQKGCHAICNLCRREGES